MGKRNGMFPMTSYTSLFKSHRLQKKLALFLDANSIVFNAEDDHAQHRADFYRRFREVNLGLKSELHWKTNFDFGRAPVLDQVVLSAVFGEYDEGLFVQLPHLLSQQAMRQHCVALLWSFCLLEPLIRELHPLLGMLERRSLFLMGTIWCELISQCQTASEQVNCFKLLLLRPGLMPYVRKGLVQFTSDATDPLNLSDWATKTLLCPELSGGVSLDVLNLLSEARENMLCWGGFFVSAYPLDSDLFKRWVETLGMTVAQGALHHLETYPEHAFVLQDWASRYKGLPDRYPELVFKVWLSQPQLSATQIDVLFEGLAAGNTEIISLFTTEPFSCELATQCIDVWCQRTSKNILEASHCVPSTQLSVWKSLVKSSRWRQFLDFYHKPPQKVEYLIQASYCDDPGFVDALKQESLRQGLFEVLISGRLWCSLTFLLLFCLHHQSILGVSDQEMKEWIRYWGQRPEELPQGLLYSMTHELRVHADWSAKDVEQLLSLLFAFYDSATTSERRYHVLRQMYLFRHSQVQKRMWRAHRQSDNLDLKWLATLGLAQQGQQQVYQALIAQRDKLFCADGLEALVGIKAEDEAIAIAQKMLKRSGNEPRESSWWEAFHVIEKYGLVQDFDEISHIRRARQANFPGMSIHARLG